MFKKIIVTLGITFLLAFVALYFTFGQITDYAVSTAINTYGPELTQTHVHVESVDISPLAGNGAIRGLEVGNPSGFKEPNAFSLGSIKVNVVPKSILTNKIEINEIDIQQPHFVLETNLNGNNIDTILQNIKDNTPSTQQNATQAAGGSSKEKKFVIHKLVVDGGTVQLGLMGQSQTFKLSKIDIQNFSPEGITGPQATAKILQVVLNQVAKQGENVALNLHQNAKDIANSAQQTASNSVNKAADHINNSLSGLLGG